LISFGFILGLVNAGNNYLQPAQMDYAG